MHNIYSNNISNGVDLFREARQIMYILYLKEPRSELDRDNNIEMIHWTMEDCLKKDSNLNFLIVHYDEITTIPDWWTIKGKQGYEEYIQEYNARQLKNKTCMELKREILDLSGIKAPKSKKFTKK
jgi:hypothetical protein